MMAKKKLLKMEIDIGSIAHAGVSIPNPFKEFKEKKSKVKSKRGKK